MTSALPRSASRDETNGRRWILFDVTWAIVTWAMLFLSSILSETLGADDALTDEDSAGKSAVERKVGSAREGFGHVSWSVDREAFDADGLEDRPRSLTHLHLPGVELAPLAAHRHEHQARGPHDAGQSKSINAIAHTGRLHGDHRALAAEPLAG